MCLAASCGGAVSAGNSDAGADVAVGADASGGDVAVIPDARDPADDPLFAAAACTSGRTWTRGNRGSESMNPGRACIDCHVTDREAPTLTLAGTVYPSGHEPDLCNGTGVGSSGEGLVVEVTDATGAVIRIVPNAVGNFESRTAFTAPYRARLIAGDVVREMQNEQTSGDCNSCHTATGSEGAPGRITAPY